MLKLRNPAAADAPPKAPTAAELAAAVRTDLAAAEAAVRTADDSYREKSLLSEIDPNNSQAFTDREAALKAAKQARDRVQQLRVKLLDAEHRASPAYADKWRRAEGAMQDRLKDVAAVAIAADALFAAYTAWKDHTAAILKEAVVEDLDGALLRNYDIEVMLKLQLARAGFAWCANGYLDPSSIPALSDRVKAANQHALAGRRA